MSICQWICLSCCYDIFSCVLLIAAANCRPSKVYLTDIHTPTLDNAKYNTSLNNTGLVEVLQVNWCQENTYPAEPIDVLIGSDLVYDKQILTLLVPTVHALLKNGK